MARLLDDVARCEGYGAGPSGHQTRMDCANCARRLAPRGGYSMMEPPASKEFPCSLRIPQDDTPQEAYEEWRNNL